MMDMLLTVAGAAACYLLARERFAPTPAAIAALGVAAGSGVLWYASGSDDPAATARFAAGAVVAYGWVRASRGRSARGQWAWGTIGVVLGLAASLAWREPLSFSGTLDVAEVLWSSRGGLLATSPAVYVSAFGLVLLLRVDRVLAAV